MSNRAWMPLHITDYLADTGHLNAAEHGAYLMLIMHYWQNGSLPEDERLLARLARMSKDEWADSRDVLAMLFGPNWTHKRIDEELAKADEIIEKRRNAALGRHQRSKSNASAQHMQSKSSDTGALPRTLDQVKKEEPIGSSKKNGCRLPAEFVPDLQWAVGQGLNPSQAQTEADKFRDYWNGKTGASATKLDWPGTWRNWVRSAVERLPQARGSPSPKAGSTSALANRAQELAQSMRSADEIRSGSSGSGIRGLVSHLPVR